MDEFVKSNNLSSYQGDNLLALAADICNALRKIRPSAAIEAMTTCIFHLLPGADSERMPALPISSVELSRPGRRHDRKAHHWGKRKLKRDQ
jgi:hypothetical protein